MLSRVKNLSANFVRTTASKVAAYFNGLAEEVVLAFRAPALVTA